MVDSGWPVSAAPERAELELVAYVRASTALTDANHRVPARPPLRHAGAPAPDPRQAVHPGTVASRLRQMPDRYCFSNAASAARDHQLLYAEGMAAFTDGGRIFCLPHAWCVLPDATALDLTWDPGRGLAYFGITFTDRSLWPTTNRGTLDDYHAVLPLLRDDLAPHQRADLGRRASLARQASRTARPAGTPSRVWSPPAAARARTPQPRRARACPPAPAIGCRR